MLSDLFKAKNIIMLFVVNLLFINNKLIYAAEIEEICNEGYCINEFSRVDANYLWHMTTVDGVIYSGAYDLGEDNYYYSFDSNGTATGYKVATNHESTRVYNLNNTLVVTTEGDNGSNSYAYRDGENVGNLGGSFVIAAGEHNGDILIGRATTNPSTIVWDCTTGACQQKEEINGVAAFDMVVYDGDLYYIGSSGGSHRNSGSAVYKGNTSVYNGTGTGARGIVFDGKLYVGFTYDALVRSYDGTTWTEEHSFEGITHFGDFEVYDNKLFVVVVEEGGNPEIWAKSGEEWTKIFSKEDLAPYGVSGDLINAAGFFTVLDNDLYMNINTPDGGRHGPGFVLKITGGSASTGSGDENSVANWVDKSKVVDHSGGGGITLRDGNRDESEALSLNDFNISFLLDMVNIGGEDTGGTSGDGGDQINCDDLTWLDENICDWEISSDLEVSTDDTSIIFDQTLTSEVETVFLDDHDMAGNTWVIMKIDGEWKASTFEWLPEGETKKFLYSVAGDHTKKDPEIPEDWVPEEGEELYFMVSSLIRMGEMNGQYRTPMVKYIWGSEEHGISEGGNSGGGSSTGDSTYPGEIRDLVEITFKGDTSVDLSYNYGSDFSVVANGGLVENIVKGTSKLLFDVVGNDGDIIDVVIKGLGVYITDGRAMDSEQLKLTFNTVDYFGDNFYIDTFTEYCNGIGRFIGNTGKNGIFKIGDSITYIPLSGYHGQDYYLDLTELDIPGVVALGEEVTIPEGHIDRIDMTFPLVEKRSSTGEYLYTCTTSPISIDNERSNFGEDIGSFSGQTGANNTYRIGDKLVYHGPYPKDEDEYIINMEILGGTAEEASETEFEIEEGSEIDDELVLNIKAIDNAGNEVSFESPSIRVDTIRPEFSNDFISKGDFIELFIPDEKINDPRYKGFVDKFGKDKEIWGDGDHLKVLMPEDDTKDEGDPLVTVDFGDISTAGNLEYTNNETDLEIELDKYYNGLYTDISEVSGYIDTMEYSKVIKYTDDAGNEVSGEIETKTKEVGIDLIGPQIPNPPPSYSKLEIMVNRLIATIGTAMKLKTPEEDVRNEVLWFSTNLSEIGGAVAEYLFEKGDLEFEIQAGEVQAGEEYNRVIYYFDKAFNLLEREIDKIIVDNKVATFDVKCGATFTIIDKNPDYLDFNQIADITNSEADELIFKAPDNSIEGCDLTTFSIDFTPISQKEDLEDVYEQIPADGREIKIEVGQGSLDDEAKQLVLKVYDEYGNEKDYLTGEFNIDNEITTRQMLNDKIEFADFDTQEEVLYIGLSDRIKIELNIEGMEDIKSVKVKIDGGMKEYELTQDPLTQEELLSNLPNTKPWKGITGLSTGHYEVEPKYITYIIVDDAGNIVELKGNQKIYISNKVPEYGGADGGTSNLHRDGFRSGNPIRGRGDYLRESELLDKKKVEEYMSESERFEKKIKFLIEHGFELGPEEKAYMKARSLNRRLNYINTREKKVENNVPSFWELLKNHFRVSRKEVIEKQKEPRQIEKKIRALVDPKKEIKNWNKLVDREGGLHTQKTLDKLRSSARKKKSKFTKPGTLRKTEVNQRGKIGSINR